MKKFTFVLIVLLALVVSAPAHAITVGITLDVHQDCITTTALRPNDFHIEGVIESFGVAPVLTIHDDGLFTPPAGTFTYTITKVSPDPADPWYTFTANWARTSGIPYCTMIHLGLVFDVGEKNTIINIIGWWTRNGVPIGDVITGNNFVNGGYAPVTGFDVSNNPIGGGQTLRITNSFQYPPPEVYPNSPPVPIDIEILQLDIVSFPADEEPPIGELREFGAQQFWQWIPLEPRPLLAHSFFDVFLNQVPGFSIPPGGFLVVRTLMGFVNNHGDYEVKWQWDIHEDPTRLLDFGDASDTYKTLLASNGARHKIVEGFHLGQFIDAEPDGQPDPNVMFDDNNPALGSDDEDGVTFVSLVQVGQTAQVIVNAAIPASMGGKLDAWVDFNKNGMWDAGEQIFSSQLLINGANALTFNVPATASVGGTVARFRLTNTATVAQTPEGYADNGEVEDHRVYIESYGVTAGITIDVHQDCDVTDLPNDFHIEGKILSHFSPPILTSHVDGLFAPPAGTFTYTISAVPDPSGYYTFTADWTLIPGSAGIPYCTIIHLGLVFAEVGNNTVGDLIGWWTHDGVKIGDLVPVGTFVNNGYVPLTGFNVTEDPAGLGQSIRISAGRNPGPQQIPIEIVAMDLVSFDTEMRPAIDQLREGGGQNWPWKHVSNRNGLQISPTNPIHLDPGTADSFFDVFFDVPLEGQPGVPHGQEFQTPPGGFLVARTQFQFTNNEGVSELRWEWNIHERPLEPLSFLQDFGDAPDTYKTLLASNGPWHVIIPGFHLGLLEDAELNGQPNATATGDDINPPTADDEDGVTMPPLIVGQPATIIVNAAIPVGILGKLDAWVDFNCNGIWDAGEQIFASEPLLDGNNPLSFVVPNFAVAGNTFARFRLSTTGGLSFDGLSDTGEVEDYQVVINAAQPTWIPGDPAKWIQMPDVSDTGIDIRDDVGDGKLRRLADDFRCTQTGPITDVHFWGSWLDDNKGNIEYIRLSIYEDIPDSDGGGPEYSKPGVELWQHTYTQGQFSEKLYRVLPTDEWEWFWDPFTGTIQQNGDHKVWQYDIGIDPLVAFIQQGTAANPKIYWLGIHVQVMPVAGSPPQFGWKTRDPIDTHYGGGHFMDDAVYGEYDGTGIPWNELRYPDPHLLAPQSLDMAFVLTGEGTQQSSLDFGDAPYVDGGLFQYPTLLANDGARHIIKPNMMLGHVIDAELDGQPNAGATGDDIAGVPDDEEGVTFYGIYPGLRTVGVYVTAFGLINAWIDFNHDGIWDASEQILVDKPVIPLVNNLLTYTVLSTAPQGPTYARFRYSTQSGLLPTGLALDGEVEDYRVIVIPTPPIIVTKFSAKIEALDTWVALASNLTTANFGIKGWYFQEADRSAGIGVMVDPDNPAPWVPGDLVSCIGKTVLIDGELMIQEAYSWKEPDGTGIPPKPLGQNNRSSGGGAVGNQPGMIDCRESPTLPGRSAVGLNTIGLLVRIWGKCTHVETDSNNVVVNAWLDDGSMLWDGTFIAAPERALGIKVHFETPPTIAITVGKSYAATGIMRTVPAGADFARCLWATDISGPYGP